VETINDGGVNMQCEVLKAVRDVLGLANYEGALKVLEKVKLIG
jgi:hypothetical protein